MKRQPMYSLADYAELKGTTKIAIERKVKYYNIDLDDYKKINDLDETHSKSDIRHYRGRSGQRRLYALSYLEEKLGKFLNKKQQDKQ